MKKFLLGVYLGVSSFFINLMNGLKKADDVIMGGDQNSAGDVGVTRQVEDSRVSHALLRGEVTQEVEDLRYRTYKVDREAKQREYFSPTLAMKREKHDSKFIKYENVDNSKLITIQPVSVNVETVNETIIRLGEEHPDMQATYNIELIRPFGFTPRYRIEEYTTQLVIREKNEMRHYLDFYVSKYANPYDRKSKGFQSELKRIREGRTNSDVVDISKLEFTTFRAYGYDDLCEFEYDNMVFKEIVEFDGFYIIRFVGVCRKKGVDVVKRDFYSERVEKRYAEKQSKEKPLDLFPTYDHREYKCDMCGKTIVYDTEEIDYAPIQAPRCVVEDPEDKNSLIPVVSDGDEEEPTNVTEYLDAEIIAATYGKTLCKECLAKFMKQMEGGVV